MLSIGEECKQDWEYNIACFCFPNSRSGEKSSYLANIGKNNHVLEKVKQNLIFNFLAEIGFKFQFFKIPLL